MKIIVSGGGTGGHIYPALTLIDAIKNKVPNAEFLYVGTKQGLEADIVPKTGIIKGNYNLTEEKEIFLREKYGIAD